MKLVSIICPVFNEEEAVPFFFARLNSVLGPLRTKYSFELIFTNNCSTDGTQALIKSLCANHNWVRLLTFSRNFGYQSSLLCGLRHAKGDATVIIDVDCEDPPEMIPAFLAGWEQGYDLVYGERLNRPEGFVLRMMRKLFYRGTRLIADYDFILDMAEFSLFTKRVRESILQNRSTFPFIRAELGFVGFSRLSLPYKRQARVSGKTHYSYVRMSQFAIGGILSSSTFFLRLAVYVGFPLTAANLVPAVLAPFTVVPLVLSQLLTALNSAFVVFFIAVLATYVARIHKDNLRRPQYIVDWEKSVWENGLGESPTLATASSLNLEASF